MNGETALAAYGSEVWTLECAHDRAIPADLLARARRLDAANFALAEAERRLGLKPRQAYARIGKIRWKPHVIDAALEAEIERAGRFTEDDAARLGLARADAAAALQRLALRRPALAALEQAA